jgi:hypothetical protein
MQVAYFPAISPTETFLLGHTLRGFVYVDEALTEVVAVDEVFEV